MWEYEGNMKKNVENMKKYVKNMKKYMENMKEYVGIHICSGTQKSEA